MAQKIRTRFAPSPTGYLHVGNLRSALYAYLLAKKNGGDFVLRVEDTDQARQVEGAVENLLKILSWAGIEPDEGVFVDADGKVAEKGNFGPYTKSKRLGIYQKYAKELVEKGMAYYCFCSSERLEKLRAQQQTNKQPTKYDGLCRNLSAAEVKKKIEAGEKFVIRMKIPENRTIEFNDLIRGTVKFNSQEVDEQVLVKSDGFPTYHLAVVVDDHLMEITHVIRGEEWLSSTPKHILLYEYFGWTPPAFSHLPLILNADRSKLSKRQGDVAVEDYRAQGYLPSAMVNFVALLGWNPGTEKELFTLSELIEWFDLAKVHKAGAVFNREKLDWLNGEYIKKMSLADFVKVAKPFILKNLPSVSDEVILEKVIALEKQRLHRLDEAGRGLEFLFADKLTYDASMLVWKKSDAAGALKNLQFVFDYLKDFDENKWQEKELQEAMMAHIKENGLNNGDVLWPMRAALTGLEKSPSPFEVAGILGKEKTLKRLMVAIEVLG